MTRSACGAYSERRAARAVARTSAASAAGNLDQCGIRCRRPGQAQHLRGERPTAVRAARMKEDDVWTDRWTGTTIGMALGAAASRYGDRDAFIFGERHPRLSRAGAGGDGGGARLPRPGHRARRSGRDLDGQPCRVGLPVLRPGQDWRGHGAAEYALQAGRAGIRAPQVRGAGARVPGRDGRRQGLRGAPARAVPGAAAGRAGPSRPPAACRTCAG